MISWLPPTPTLTGEFTYPSERRQTGANTFRLDHAVETDR